MYRDKYRIKYLSRKVVLAWKKAADSQAISWQEIFPLICALYELDDNYQKDETFKTLNIEKQPFYSHFQEILNELNITNHDIHYFRKLTKHLLKTYLDVNKELHKLQSKNNLMGGKSRKGSIGSRTSDKNDSENELIIPSVIVEELINFYIELKKADSDNNNNNNVKIKKDERDDNKELNKTKPNPNRRRKSISANNTNQLAVPHTHRRQRSYSTTDIPTKNGVNFRDEGKSIIKPKMTQKRNNIPPVNSNRSPSITLSYMKEMNKVTSTSPVSAITSPLSASTLAGNDLMSTFVNYVSTPSPNISINKKIVPPPNANVITVKHSKKSKLRKIKKMSLRVATNIGIKGNKELKNFEECSSANDDSFSSYSSSSQNSYRLDDMLFMTPLVVDTNNNNHHSNSNSNSIANTSFNNNFNSNTNSASDDSPQSAATVVEQPPSYPPRNVSLTLSRKYQNNGGTSKSSFSSNNTSLGRSGGGGSGRLEDLYINVSGNCTSPSLTSSSQTLMGTPNLNKNATSPYNSPALFQSQSQSQASYASDMSSPYMSSTTTVFNKDNLYRFKESNFNKFGTPRGSIYAQNPLKKSGFSPYNEPLPSLPMNEKNSSKFNPYEEPLPPFPLPPLNLPESVTPNFEESSSSTQSPSQSQPLNSSSNNNNYSPTQLFSQSSLNSGSNNYNGLSYIEEQLLEEEDDFEINNILNKYDGMNSQRSSLTFSSQSLSTLPPVSGLNHPLFKNNGVAMDSSFLRGNGVATMEPLEPSFYINNGVGAESSLFKNNNAALMKGRGQSQPLFKNNCLSIEGYKYINQSPFLGEGMPGDMAYGVDDHNNHLGENEEREEEEEVVHQFEDQLQRDEKELDEIVAIETRIHNQEEDDEDENDNEYEYEYRYQYGNNGDDNNANKVQNSIVITDSSVIDNLEDDLLSHKVKTRKSSIGSNTISNLKSNQRLSMINEVDEEEINDPNIIMEKEGKNKNQKEGFEEDTLSDEKKNLEEEKKKLDKIKKNQFRLSFLTSKSSCHSLKAVLNKAKEENESEGDSDSESVSDNDYRSTETDEVDESEKEKEKEKEKENKKENEEEEEEAFIETPTPKKVSIASEGKKHHHLLSNRSKLFIINDVKNEEKISDASGNQKNDNNKKSVYFVHPVQLYNIIQMIYIYTIAKLPKRAKTITQQWMSTTNDMALVFWGILKAKEDIISNIIIYSTFYDHVQVKVFPLNDPNHVFLKELVSDDSENELKVETTTPTKEATEAGEKKEEIGKFREEEEEMEEPLSAVSRGSDMYSKEFSFTTNEIFQKYESQMTNKKLIMEIKK
jgi:hypothetical protein